MATIVAGLHCVCGNKTVCKCVEDVEGVKVNQLYCCECGIIMRSPAKTDADGTWLVKHWREIHSRRHDKNYCYACQAWIRDYLCSNPESDYFGCETNSKFGCDVWVEGRNEE